MEKDRSVGRDEGRGSAGEGWDALRATEVQGATWDDLRHEEFAGERHDVGTEAVDEPEIVMTGTGEIIVDGQESGEVTRNGEYGEARTDLSAYGLDVMPREAVRERKEVGEMEPGEVAREYLDLLRSLGSNFTSPEGQASAVVRADGSKDPRGYSGDRKFVEQIYKLGGMELDKGDNSAELRERGRGLEELEFENEDLDWALNLHLVDKILEGEQRWEDAGEDFAQAQATVEKATERLEKLEKEGKSMGILGKIRTFGARRKEKKELKAAIAQAQVKMTQAEVKTRQSDQALQRQLGMAYSPDYRYGSHQESAEHRNDEEYQARVNDEYNQRFFEGREEEVKRALELRRKLVEMKQGGQERPQDDRFYDDLGR